jgi:hypothetical protein
MPLGTLPFHVGDIGVHAVAAVRTRHATVLAAVQLQPGPWYGTTCTS